MPSFIALWHGIYFDIMLLGYQQELGSIGKKYFVMTVVSVVGWFSTKQTLLAYHGDDQLIH